MEKLTVAQLKDKCKEQGLKFTSKSKKNELLALLGVIVDTTNNEQNDNVERNVDKGDIKSLFLACFNILRSEGIVGEKGLRYLSYLLSWRLLEPHFNNNTIDISDVKHYEKLIDDQEKLKDFISYVKWDNLFKEKNRFEQECRNTWNIVLCNHPKLSTMFKENNFPNIKIENLKKIMETIHSYDLFNVDHDMLGQAYESVIREGLTGKVLGQFFTPTELRNYMINVIKPKDNESIFDPCCGSGGFLISSKKYNKNINIYGREINEETFQLLKSNILISTGEINNNTQLGDSLIGVKDKKFDIILTNPPFGLKNTRYRDIVNKNNIVDDKNNSLVFPIKSDNASLLFLELCIYKLKEGGRCCIVLPDGKEMFLH